MKKLSLTLAALALVLGMSQCKKQEEPVQNGEKQHIVLNASFAESNSKIAEDGIGGLKWSDEEGNEDHIIVKQGETELGELECTDAEDGIFEGDITSTTGNITFTFGTQNFTEQTGNLNAAIYLTAETEYVSSGNYDVTMNMPHAVLKLDVSALGTTGAMTIAANGATVASVTDVASSEGKAVFVAVPTDGTEKTYSIEVNSYGAVKTWELEANTFYTKQGTTDGSAIVIAPVYVDLGLSVKWATCNVGADSPEEYGDYFAWGETETKSDYSWSTYKWCNGSGNTLTKYCTDSRYGTVDNKTVLDVEDDAARAAWGGDWRMPTKEEWQALYDNNTFEWLAAGATSEKVTTFTAPCAGRLVVKGKDASLDASVYMFLPAAGYRNGTSLNTAGSSGRCWSSSLLSSDPSIAYYMYFNSDDVGPQYNHYRFFGLAVRPVR